jgi:hypothetical protein
VTPGERLFPASMLRTRPLGGKKLPSFFLRTVSGAAQGWGVGCLVSKQPALSLYPSTVASQASADRHDAVTGHQDGDRIVMIRPPHRASPTFVPHFSRDFPVGTNLSPWDGKKCQPDRALEGGSPKVQNR